MAEFKRPAHRDGLVWDDSGWDMEPRWTREPQADAIEAVCRRALAVKSEDTCTVAFHAAGAFNKLYLITTESTKALLRVALPVDPKHKTQGEVTTLRWVRRHTTVPVPKVIAFDDSQDNEIGFEWILMQLMDGVSAYKRWRTMSMPDKIWFVEQVADFQSQLFRHSFETEKLTCIGTLCLDNNENSSMNNNNNSYRAPAPLSTVTAAKPGRLVNRSFFWGEHFNYDVPRGPYQSTHDWLRAHLAIIRQAQNDIIEKVEALESPDEDDQDEQADARQRLKVVDKLESMLPCIFPSVQFPAEPTVLWHDDLSLMNILVDDDGKITAVVDWECVSAHALWMATATPDFLRGPNREKEPERDGYGDETASEKAKAQAQTEDEDLLDNQGKTDLYWDHLMQYEQTQLRKVYTAKLKHLWPHWEIVENESDLKLDFWEAVARCGDGWHLDAISKWIDALQGVDALSSAFPRLVKFLDPTGYIYNPCQ